MVTRNYPPPTAEEIETVRQAAEKLTPSANGAEPPRYFIHDSQGEEAIELPPAIVAILSDMLKLMARDQGISLFPRIAEQTTASAARLLNVSQPYLIKLLDEGLIPYRMVGERRRIPLADLIEYHERTKRKREAILDQMVAEAQEMGLYDL